ncbi:MAG: SMP-30/gluconolactonase/LRE family protein [Desulfobacterales bacterium]|jgi:sugar lactone lactonase YvrE
MIKKILWSLLAIIIVIILYFLLWPVAIDPVAWEAPPNPGYTGSFLVNERLKGIETFAIAGNHGPEDIAVDSQGRIYTTSHEGHIVRLNADCSNPQNWVDTKGRPLGIDFDEKGNLIVADAFRGLISISPDGSISELATAADGLQIGFANNVDVAADGKIYFSDSSTKFHAKEWGGPYEAARLELMEHGGHGRLLVYDPTTRVAKTLLKGLTYANGVAISHDQTFVLVSEMGEYRVIRFWIAGPEKGKSETLIGSLPSFPDNITTGLEGRYWIAFVSPRNQLMDKLATKPFLRKVIWRMPNFMRPKAIAYGHIFAIDDNGKVVADLQDPDGNYPINTGVTETKDHIYVGSLVAPVLGRLKKEKIGL